MVQNRRKMKNTLIQLGTGLIAKLLRYAITAAGGTIASTSMADGKPLDVEQLAGGIAAVLVALGWSVWEDRVKAKTGEAASAASPSA